MKTKLYTRRIAGLLAAVTLAATPASALRFDSYEQIRDLLCSRFGICLEDVQRPGKPEIELPEQNRPEEKPETDAPEMETPDIEDNNADAYVSEVVRLVNAERAKAGLPALSMNRTVNAAAQVRAREIVSNFSHTRPSGANCFTALQEAGVRYRGAGENIAYGQSSAQAVVNAWMNSAGHRANILNKNFTTIGVGHHVRNGVHYWTQFFVN